MYDICFMCVCMRVFMCACVCLCVSECVCVFLQTLPNYKPAGYAMQINKYMSLYVRVCVLGVPNTRTNEKWKYRNGQPPESFFSPC